MIGYVLDKQSFLIKGFFEYKNYEFSQDLEFGEKSKITQISKKAPAIQNKDIVICKDGNEVIFAGICESFEGNGKNGFSLQLKQTECIFDRNILLNSPEMIQTTGIEDFIAKSIEENWIDSGDPLLDSESMTVTATTHTPISVVPDGEAGVINLMDFISQAKELWKIQLEFDVDNGALAVRIKKDQSATIEISGNMSDVKNLKETYDVDILAKLQIRWKIPDTVEDGVVTEVGAVEDVTAFMTESGELTTNVDDPDRIDGVADSVYIEADEVEEVIQKVYDIFQRNKYNHNIAFDLNKTSKAYPVEEFFVGRSIRIKTDAGITESIISARTIKYNSAYITITLGTKKISLVSKIRSMQRRES